MTMRTRLLQQVFRQLRQATSRVEFIGKVAVEGPAITFSACVPQQSKVGTRSCSMTSQWYCQNAKQQVGSRLRSNIRMEKCLQCMRDDVRDEGELPWQSNESVHTHAEDALVLSGLQLRCCKPSDCCNTRRSFLLACRCCAPDSGRFFRCPLTRPALTPGLCTAALNLRA